MLIKELVEVYSPEKLLLKNIRKLSADLPEVRFMEVCGTHTMAIARNGIRQMLPDNVKLLSGPGCPVCVSTPEQIDQAIEICRLHEVTILTFGDMLRVPGGRGESLADLRRQGHDVRIVYSPLDCLTIAKADLERKFLFLSVGFETTAPTVAATILRASAEKIRNLFFLSMHKLIPPAMEELLLDARCNVNGFLCPGHVSAIIGLQPYKELSEKYGAPCVIGGFEGIDILQSLEMLLRQVKFGPNAEIQYHRCVKPQGNPKAVALMYSVFDASNSEWRGIGNINISGLSIKDEFADLDANLHFKVKVRPQTGKSNCICGDILKGLKLPGDCRLINKACFPDRPVGPCMVSSEGACAAYYKYEQYRTAA